MGQVNNCFYQVVLRTSLGAMHRHLNNNTPVNTEVLWGGGLWWGVTTDKRPIGQASTADRERQRVHSQQCQQYIHIERGSPRMIRS